MTFEAKLAPGNNHTAFWVRDLEAIEKFYVEVVGLRIVSQRRNSPRNPDATFFTGLQLLRAPTGRDVSTKGVLDHVGINVANMDQIIANLAANGVGLDGSINVANPGGNGVPRVRTAFFADPEGNRIELIERGQV
ncbi:MAG: VOC family protein [Chloroflexota bacterium]|nr:MAG: VOC family protein [Chloroflexota bacterium]